jgi:hypothetical protein
MKKIKIYILGIMVLVGCVKEADWQAFEQAPVLIAVEATLTDEQKAHKVQITFPVNELNELPQPVTGATVLVSNEYADWVLQEDTAHSGYYYTDSGFVALLNMNYTLQIFYQDMLYSAKASMVPGKFFNPLLYKQNSDDEWYHIDWVASAFDAENPAMWEILIDWSEVPGFQNQSTEDCKARLLFYSLPSLDVSEIFAPAVEDINFPPGSLITQRRYSLTPDYAEYLRTLLLETTWQGSLFPSANANVSTNLSEGAAGYFSVCAVTQLSFIVQ